MREIEHAELLPAMALKDFKALEGMRDPDIFEEEIFGFHAQQAIEKTLKAWLSLLGIEYQNIHDIERLLSILKQSGENVKDLWDLMEFNLFAVQFRYEPIALTEDTFDRVEIIRRIKLLINPVHDLIESRKPSQSTSQ